MRMRQSTAASLDFLIFRHVAVDHGLVAGSGSVAVCGVAVQAGCLVI